jgi:YD repeat-containing protein
MYPVPLVMRPAAGTMVVLPSTMLIEVRAGHVLQDPVIRLAPTASMPPNQPTAYAGADSAAPNLTFTYDGDGLRAGTTRTPSIGGAPSTTAYVWDTSAGLPVLLQAADNQYLYGPDARPYAQIDRPNRDITYLHADALGSTDNTGTRVATWTYDAYGNTTTHTGTVPVRRRIPRQRHRPLLPTRPLLRPNHRHLPQSRPLEASTGLAYTYTYSSGNPLQDTDSTGLRGAKAWLSSNVETLTGQSAFAANSCERQDQASRDKANAHNAAVSAFRVGASDLADGFSEGLVQGATLGSPANPKTTTHTTASAASSGKATGRYSASSPVLALAVRQFRGLRPPWRRRLPRHEVEPRSYV